MSSDRPFIAHLSDLWSLTRFDGPELSAYAENLLFKDAQRGLITLGFVSMTMQLLAASAYALLGFDPMYVYSCFVLAMLSIHIAISARYVRESRVLYLLGTTLLTVNGVAFVLLAHQAGSLDAALFTAVILLFLVMPLVPWGLREGLLIVLLVYALFTFSTLSVEGRFDHKTLWMLQLAMIAGGGATLTVIVRNIIIRRDDIRTRFELEKAHNRMATLSLKDPLTGAWNRRFLDQNFEKIHLDMVRHQRSLQLALIDIDDFKKINDSQGHDFGDMVLMRLAANFMAGFEDGEHLMRLGGDEFMVLMSREDAREYVERSAVALQTDPQLLSGSADTQVNVSIGLLEFPGDQAVSLNRIYRAADEALYRAKSRKHAIAGPSIEQAGLAGAG